MSSSNRPDGFLHALNTANTWLADIAEALGTGDRHYARRALRAWLHTLRDRLTVDAAAKFAAQLPELLRGMFYEGWDPSRSPIKYGTDQYIQRFAWEARISTTQVAGVAGTITSVLSGRLSPGQLDEPFAVLPADLRKLIAGEPEPRRQPEAPPAAAARDEEFATLQEQVNTLAEAVRTLARALEDRRLSGLDLDQVAKGARLADEILMTVGR